MELDFYVTAQRVQELESKFSDTKFQEKQLKKVNF